MTATQQPTRSPDITAEPIRRPVKHSRFPLVDLYKTAVGKKWVMAITGIALMAYVLGHMIGNLKMYLGPEHINTYGEFLRDMGEPILPRTVLLWIIRVGLIAMFAIHIHAAYSLTMMNRQARPVGYQSPRDYIAASWAARTMRWTGVLVLLFVVWHLADLTWGWVNPGFVRGDVYRNLVASFQRWPVSLLYVVANMALALHLYHGAWSIFQSLGSMSPRFNPRHNPIRNWFAVGFAVLVCGVNITFPIAVMTGLVD